MGNNFFIAHGEKSYSNSVLGCTLKHLIGVQDLIVFSCLKACFCHKPLRSSSNFITRWLSITCHKKKMPLSFNPMVNFMIAYINNYLYWLAAPSLKYKIWIIAGNFSLMYIITLPANVCTVFVSCLVVQSEMTQKPKHFRIHFEDTQKLKH